MGKTIYLKIDTQYGVITIPFMGINEVDDFTVRYDNMKELVITLIKVLKLNIELYDTYNVYLTYDKYKREMDDSCLDIKYKNDNFNTNSLMGVFCEYLVREPRRIWESDIRYVKTNGMLTFINTGKISRFDIQNAVSAYLNGDKNYRRKRDTYFYLRDYLPKGLSIQIDKVEEEKNVRNADLSNYDIEDDSYLSHLIQLYKRGDYQFDEAMEHIAKADLYELGKLLKSDGYGIVDGVSELSISTSKDIKMLELCTGMSIDNLRVNHSGFGRKKGF